MTSAADAPAAKPGPRLLLSIIVIVIGTIVGITGLSLFIARAVHDVQNIHGFPGTTPVEGSLQLTTGTWQVYVVEPNDDANLVQPSDVTVTGPGGSSISATAMPSGETEDLTRSGDKYYAEVRFKVDQAGSYNVAVKPSSGSQQIYVAKSLGDLVKHDAAWLLMMLAGILVGIIGVVMLIVGIVRRRRASQPMTPAYAGGYAPAYPPAGAAPQPGMAPVTAPTTAAQPAAGWYPDPQIPGTQRWWDGTRWTDQTKTE
jgi:hypothetical protein